MTTSPTSLCPRCGGPSNRVARNLRCCRDWNCMEVFLMKAQTYQQLIVDREKERLAGFQKREAALRRDIMEAVKRFVKTSP